MQFNYYYELYNKYVELQGRLKANLSLDYVINEDISLSINDEIYLDGSTIIITDDFIHINSEQLVDKFESLAYRLKIKALVTYLLAFGGGIISLDDDIQLVNRLIIRQITTTAQYVDIVLHINEAQDILKQVLRYYIRSLFHPILIHKDAIQKYASLIKQGKAYDLCVDAAKTQYINEYNNYDLDKIRQDTIYSSIADNYFDFIDNIKGVNDIIKIGEILARCSKTNVSNKVE
jgi:hypothetical protein